MPTPIANLGGTKGAEHDACRASLRLLATELSRVEDLERQRIAGDLHDYLGQTLVSAQLRLSDLERSDCGEALVREIREVRLLIKEAINCTRTLNFELLAPVMPEVGIESELEHLATRMSEKHGVPCQFEVDCRAKPLGAEVAVAVLRFVREALLNIRKHSQARKASISAMRVGDQIQVTVADDGIGFQPNPHTEPERVGFGLLIIRERLAEIGGQLEIVSRSELGTRMIVTAPLLKPA